MSEIIVSNLKQHLEMTGVDTLHLSDKEAQLFSQAVENKAEFFDRLCRSKTDKDPLMLLLGLLTKSHIEATAKLEPQIEAIQAMNNVFTDTIGSEQAHKFEADALIELSLVTKLWLMVQGYLNMDFSLANDHAQQTSDILAKALKAESDEIRSELLASYYHGKTKHEEDVPHTPWPKKLLSWLNIA
ncbi:hypothetical protein L3Q72_16575 [Vibrio sp. JC009]|uniref:hypothetical protein n=1 Tax=Vibrio sp. JC009 TaxID=2912314 RepID=UPI0023B02318|nr:hypothetical protein [Vibrio sp. JC009]WED24490.1 hypothetical protein L3Q72_16575 [Vibrio sp. JC009]